MIDLESNEDLVSRAFDLACFIQRDRRAAISIVTRALAKLEVVAKAQGKRLYYRPSGRSWSLRLQSDRLRNKISLSEPHLFQRLIYLESEPYEIAQEQLNGAAGIGEEDLVIHFIKHLVKKTTKRNSFYVTLGLGRLLHSYTTAETMDIYNAVIQDPERVKDDFYYRSRKGILMKELKQRFGSLINICHGPRGEERFESDDNPTRFVQVVRDCLNFFTPWNTPCLVPAGVDPIREGIPPLSFRSGQEEDEIEMNRIHAVLHPDCFYRLIADLRFDSPDTRLTIPRFFNAKDTNGNGLTDPRHEESLSEEELHSIKRELDNNSARRKAAHARVLRVMVDGNERARFDLSEMRSARFRLERDAELIEVRSSDNDGEEVLLALHPLEYGEADDEMQPANTSITLEGGQKISIFISPMSGQSDATVNISYRETNPFQAASFLFHHLLQSISRGSSQIDWKDRKILAPVLAVLLLTITFFAIIRYAREGNAPSAQQSQVATSQQTVAASGNEVSGTGNAATDKNKTSNEAGASGQQRKNFGPSPKSGNLARKPAEPKPETKTLPETATETGMETRGLKINRAALPLSAVRKVYVEIRGNEISRQPLRQALSERLRGGITLVSNRDDADALLQVSAVKGAETESQLTVLVELIDARGRVIWPDPNSDGKYRGSAADVSAGIVKDLLAAIQKSTRTR